MPLRKRAFRSASDEYLRILDVVTKYAVHNPHCAWVCKKAGSSLPDVSTSAGSTAQANIGLLYTATLATELLEVPETILPAKLGASVRGWVSNANSNWARKGGWLLFINNRLVESTKIKKAVEALYSAFLAKGSSPFVYLSLTIDPAKVDVNVHPTKSEVHFLNEDEIIDGLVAAVEKALAGANVSRSFTVQTLLPGADASDKRGEPSQTQRKPAPNYKVRMDPTNRTLDSMVATINPSLVAPDDRPTKRRGVTDDEVITIDDETPLWNAAPPEDKTNDIPESVCDFTSIQDLRQAVAKKASADLTETLTRHAYVGLVDSDMSLSLLQHSTRLLLVNHAALA